MFNRAIDLTQTVLNTTADQPKAVLSWYLFIDAIVHTNADIPTVAKVQNLIQSLEGEARKPLERKHQDQLRCRVDAPLKTYDNWQILFRKINDLPGVKKESTDYLLELMDVFQEYMKTLAKLNEPVQHWGTPLVNLLSCCI